MLTVHKLVMAELQSVLESVMRRSISKISHSLLSMATSLIRKLLCFHRILTFDNNDAGDNGTIVIEKSGSWSCMMSIEKEEVAWLLHSCLLGSKSESTLCVAISLSRLGNYISWSMPVFIHASC